MVEKDNKTGARKKPTATIDLKAKELKDKKPADSRLTSRVGSSQSSDEKLRSNLSNGKKTNNKTGADSTKRPHPAGRGKSGGSSSGGFLSHMMAAGIGGLMALLGWNFFGAQDTPLSGQALNLAPIESKIADLSNKLAAIDSSRTGEGAPGSADVSALKSMTERLGKAEAMLDNLATTQATLAQRSSDLSGKISAGGGNEDAIKTRMERLETSFETISQAASSGGANVRDAAVLATKISEAEQRFDKSLANRIAALKNNLDTTLQDRFATFKQSQSDQSGMASKLSALSTRSQSVSEEISALKTGNAELRGETASLKENTKWLQDQNAKILATAAELKNQTQRLQSQIAINQKISAKLAPVADRMDLLEQKIGGVVEREETARAEGRNTAMAIALTNLKRAVNQGSPYVPEFDTLKLLSPKDIDLGPLKAGAAKGLRTVGTLSKNFRKFAGAALDADAGTSSDSIVDRLLSNAKSIVRVRKKGMVEGDSGGAIISRMEHRLSQGQLVEVLEESALLGSAAKQAFAPWLEQVRARVDGNRALSQLEGKILAALGGTMTQ